jgi:hypothetical protein
MDRIGERVGREMLEREGCALVGGGVEESGYIDVATNVSSVLEKVRGH